MACFPHSRGQVLASRIPCAASTFLPAPVHIYRVIRNRIRHQGTTVPRYLKSPLVFISSRTVPTTQPTQGLGSHTSWEPLLKLLSLQARSTIHLVRACIGLSASHHVSPIPSPGPWSPFPTAVDRLPGHPAHQPFPTLIISPQNKNVSKHLDLETCTFGPCALP